MTEERIVLHIYFIDVKDGGGKATVQGKTLFGLPIERDGSRFTRFLRPDGWKIRELILPSWRQDNEYEVTQPDGTTFRLVRVNTSRPEGGWQNLLLLPKEHWTPVEEERRFAAYNKRRILEYLHNMEADRVEWCA